MKKFLLNRKGFTLIELLIVISIIAVIATIGFAVYSNLNTGPKSRNAVRKADLDSIAKALEVNFSKTIAGNYDVLADTQFSNSKIPALDPQGNEYCANAVASKQPAVPAAKWTTGAAGCSVAGISGEWSAVSTSKPATGAAWKICTWLEDEDGVGAGAAIAFCKISSQ